MPLKENKSFRQNIIEPQIWFVGNAVVKIELQNDCSE